MRSKTAASALCGVISVLVSAALAQDYRPGDMVVVIADAKLTVEGKGDVDDVWPGLVLRVQGVDGERLWLSNGHPGWLDRRHVIPLNRAALDRLTAMLRADPRNATLYSGRADVWKHLGELDIAIGDYSEAIRLDPSAAYYDNRGDAWDAKGEYDKAIADYNEALRIDPNDAVAYNNRGNAWHSKGEYDKAIADYNEALRIDPNSAYAYVNRGNSRYVKGEYDKAIEDYNNALRIDPKLPNAYLNRGSAWKAKGEYDKAIADYNKALRVNPRYAYAYNNRGSAWYAKGEYDRAIEDYNKALRVDPRYVTAYHNRGLAWKLKGEYDKAVADYNEALRVDPQYVNSYKGLAWLRATCPEARYRDGKQAVAAATKACELTGWKKANCIGTLAAAYAESGDFEKAVKWQTKAVELAKGADKAGFTERLRLYKAGKPYREESK